MNHKNAADAESVKNDLGDFFDLGALPFGEELKDTGIASSAGLLGVLAWEAGIEHIPLPPNAHPALFPAGEAIVGAIAGPLLSMYAPKAGLGVGVAMVTSGLTRMLRHTSMGAKVFPAASQPVTAPATAPSNPAPGVAGLGAPQSLLLGDSAVDIETVNPNLGDSAVSIEDTTDELSGLAGIF